MICDCCRPRHCRHRLPYFSLSAARRRDGGLRLPYDLAFVLTKWRPRVGLERTSGRSCWSEGIARVHCFAASRSTACSIYDVISPVPIRLFTHPTIICLAVRGTNQHRELTGIKHRQAVRAVVSSSSSSPSQQQQPESTINQLV